MGKTLLLFFILSSTYGQTCISHRANTGQDPENSLEAIEEAVSRDFSGIEFDIQFSKDGVPFLYHDKVLGKGLQGEMCPIGKKVSKLFFKDFYSDCFLENGSRMATFDQALDSIKTFSGYIFIDVKQKPSSHFIESIKESQLEYNEKVYFLSFKKRALRPLKRKFPKTKSILLSRYIPRGLFYDGIGFNKRLNFFTGIFKKLKKDVAIWTLNEEKHIKKAIKKKATFIITDKYDLCLDSLI